MAKYSQKLVDRICSLIREDSYKQGYLLYLDENKIRLFRLYKKSGRRTDAILCCRGPEVFIKEDSRL